MKVNNINKICRTKDTRTRLNYKKNILEMKLKNLKLHINHKN